MKTYLLLPKKKNDNKPYEIGIDKNCQVEINIKTRD